jgi:hypothetical protein
VLVVTFDIDWAPDFAIDAAAAQLRAAGVRATWFVTHASPAVDRLRESPDLFELGIHPNFFAHSSHGDSLEEVLDHVKRLVPEARSIRSHGLYHSSRVLAAIARDDRLEVDSSIFLPGHPHLRPVPLRLGGHSITRIPYFWSEEYEWELERPNWSLDPIVAGEGLKVLNFHPIHVFLNSADGAPYQALKAAAPSLPDVDVALAQSKVNPGSGTRTLFDRAVDHLRREGTSRTLVDVARATNDRSPSASGT